MCVTRPVSHHQCNGCKHLSNIPYVIGRCNNLQTPHYTRPWTKVSLCYHHSEGKIGSAIVNRVWPTKETERRP